MPVNGPVSSFAMMGIIQRALSADRMLLAARSFHQAGNKNTCIDEPSHGAMVR